ncbi:hypothetical protein ACJX0J_028663 [Zea mays]
MIRGLLCSVSILHQMLRETYSPQSTCIEVPQITLYTLFKISPEMRQASHFDKTSEAVNKASFYLVFVPIPRKHTKIKGWNAHYIYKFLDIITVTVSSEQRNPQFDNFDEFNTKYAGVIDKKSRGVLEKSKYRRLLPQR